MLKTYIQLNILSFAYCKNKTKIADINTAQNYIRSKMSGIF